MASGEDHARLTKALGDARRAQREANAAQEEARRCTRTAERRAARYLRLYEEFSGQLKLELE